MEDEINLDLTQKDSRQAYDLPAFEIFGIKLYNDDLLILGMLFFLYSEGVHDDELFLILLLLLIE